MHQSDLDWYVANHPGSELARLATGGAEYTNAQTADPSDSAPTGTGLMTGGDPKVTGIYYDDEYSHDVFPPGTTKCAGPVPGGNVIYDSPDDKLPAVPDLLHNGSGNTFPAFDEDGSIYPGGMTTNPALIMNLTPHPQSGLNPATYPVDPKTCKPIQPWDYVGVNTIFFGVSTSDPRHPDVFGIAQVGTIYTTGTKIAEHGGDNPGDRDVPLVVYAPGIVQPGQISNGVETTQVAPTILTLLGLNPRDLQAVQIEHTRALPGV